MNEKRKILVLMSLGVLIALFLVYVSWRSGSDTTEQAVSHSNSPDIIIKPTQDYTSKYITIRQTSPGTPPVEDAGRQNTLPPQPGTGTMSGGSQLPGGSQQGPQSLTKEEVFNRLWPPVYREALQGLETHMVEQGFMKEEEKHRTISADEDIYAIITKLIDYVEQQGWVPAEDAAKLRVGLSQDLPKQIEGERKALEANGLGTERILPRNQHIAQSDDKSLAIGIIDGLKYIFSAQYADALIIPGWHTLPDCYKDLAPFNPIPGFNSIAICCNCGLLCIPPFVCTFIPDCGPFSIACTIPLGCLNLNCKLWPNAIWDAPWNPLGYGTCGCG